MQFQRFTVRPLTAALALACGFMCSSARAEDPNPYYIGASAAVTHDSNVFRASSDPAKRPPGTEIASDTYTSLGLLGGIDQPFGRQRFYANGSVRYNRFDSQSQLNNTGYGLNTGLDLSTINHITGSLTYSVNQNLFNYGGGNIVTFTGRNIEKSQQAAARVSWGLVSLWSLDANANHRSLRYSNSSYQFANLDQDAGSIGVTYRPSGLISGGVAVRQTRGKYPSPFQGSATGFDRTDLDLTSTWIPTGQSTVSGRISYGRQKYDGVAGDRNKLTSGFVSWDYRPTGRLGFTLLASRDTGAESSFINFGTLVGNAQTAVGDNSQRSSQIALTSTYSLTGKISLTGNARYVKRNYNNSITGIQSFTGTDTNKVLSLAANYQALRNVAFSCNVSRDTRDAEGSFSFPYKDTSFGCSGQITLQ